MYANLDSPIMRENKMYWQVCWSFSCWSDGSSVSSHEKLTYHCNSIRFKHLLTQSISDRTELIPVSSHVGMGRFSTEMTKRHCSMFLPISTCHDTEALGMFWLSFM